MEQVVGARRHGLDHAIAFSAEASTDQLRDRPNALVQHYARTCVRTLGPLADPKPGAAPAVSARRSGACPSFALALPRKPADGP